MFCAPRILVLTVAVLAALFASPAVASANWITIKNDTGKAIVVQEIVVVKGETKRGKATTLLPGETLREFLPAPTVKRLEVFESRTPDRAAWSGSLDCKDNTQTFSVAVAASKVTVSTVVPRQK
jgi:hypothetical protein